MDREEPSLSASGFVARLRYLLSRGTVAPLLSGTAAFVGFVVASLSFTLQERSVSQADARLQVEAMSRTLRAAELQAAANAAAKANARSVVELSQELRQISDLVSDLPASPQKDEIVFRLGTISGIVNTIKFAAQAEPRLPPGKGERGINPSSFAVDESVNFRRIAVVAEEGNSLSVANAPPKEVMSSSIKMYIVLAIFGVLGITFLGAVLAVFTTKDEKAFAFATDTIKTLLGFFIGVITTFMGIPSAS